MEQNYVQPQVFPETVSTEGVETVTLISEGLLIVAKCKDGALLGAAGKKVKAHPIELDHIFVEDGDKTYTYQLGVGVKWIDEGMVH